MYTLRIWYADGRVEARSFTAKSASIKVSSRGLLRLKIVKNDHAISAQFFQGVQRAALER